ncbi:MAG: Hsp20/alpha crystallin family protein [Chloroflexi bacterium]|nr:Hsp20/alpha crystallin family protein [Chloroflexota bacterium]
MAIVVRSSSRALSLREPHYHPFRLFEDVDRMAMEMWESWTPSEWRSDFFPRLDMYEQKDELVMRAELPGIKKEDIDISLEGECLTIKAEKRQEEVSEDVKSYTCERCFGQYLRTVTLPFPVDANNISATFENGLLEIRLPKSAEVKAKHIAITIK